MQSEQTWGLKCVLWICLKANISIQRQAERVLTSVQNPQAAAGSLDPVNHHTPLKWTKAGMIWTFQAQGWKVTTFLLQTRNILLQWSFVSKKKKEKTERRWKVESLDAKQVSSLCTPNL